ncbi:MAG TPA: hypothetical protein VG206_18195 [Terriglobia bacterium]|nr:hypothetical protein [Terriglobia bacterium]
MLVAPTVDPAQPGCAGFATQHAIDMAGRDAQKLLRAPYSISMV